MPDLIRAGGVPMLFIVAFGALALGAAARFAWRPDPRRVAAVRALSLATLASIGSGTCADLAAVASKVPANPAWAHGPDLPLIVMQGIGESMAPGIAGFTLLSLVGLVMAVGHRRDQ